MLWSIRYWYCWEKISYCWERNSCTTWVSERLWNTHTHTQPNHESTSTRFRVSLNQQEWNMCISWLPSGGLHGFIAACRCLRGSQHHCLQFAEDAFHIFLAFSGWYFESEGGWNPFCLSMCPCTSSNSPLWPTQTHQSKPWVPMRNSVSPTATDPWGCTSEIR